MYVLSTATTKWRQAVTAKSPSKGLEKLSTKLFSTQREQESFVLALSSPIESGAMIVLADNFDRSHFETLPRLKWQPSFVDRLSPSVRAGGDPLHDEGAYYCLDFSSVFDASVTLSITEPVNSVLDVCASPGGKSIFAWKALHPNRLVCNEVIGKRRAALISNIRRCRVEAEVISKDSKILAELFPNEFDLVIVDAPCSGQSLLAKGERSGGCFHPATINMNSNRQKRIIANSCQTVRPGGYLAYMTCTFSPEENENVVEWLVRKFPDFQPVVCPFLGEFQSDLSEFPCYRLWPQSRIGAGGFTALLRRGEA